MAIMSKMKGGMDEMRYKMEDAKIEGMRKEFMELREKEKSGMLDDSGRARLIRLRERMGL